MPAWHQPLPRTALCAALVLALVAAAPAGAQEAATSPSPAQASAALDAATEALDPTAGAAGQPAPDATPALAALSAALPALEGRERRLARELLARPTDGAADQYGDGYPAAGDVRSVEGAHFCVFWVDDAGNPDAPDLTDSNGDGTPDYVASILEIAEHSYAVEVAPGPLAWAAPKPDTSGCGADPAARSDVYLTELGNQGLFGYESPDPGQGKQRSQYGYLVLDNDYSKAEYGYDDPLLPAKVTVAHEFNHLLQQNYDSFQDLWMFESTAVWAEEQVYPEINDYVNYVSDFASSPNTPLTDRSAAGGLKIYGSAVWNHWLDRGAGLGPDAIRGAWEVSGSTSPPDFAVGAYDRVARSRGGEGFSPQFARFAAATAEWQTGSSRFPDAQAYPDVRRKGSLKRGAERRLRLDHTAYRLLSVSSTGGKRLRLSIDAEPGVRTGIALVGRQGPATTGQVTRHVRYLAQGGSGSVGLGSPKRFARVTAVVANADGRVRGFGGADWNYRADGARYELSLAR